jgi:cytochrome d ubiquinol oxidase subunit I
MYTAAAVSPGVTPGEMLFSVITLTLVYAALLVVELSIMVRFVRGGVAAAMPELGKHDDNDTGDDPDKRDVLAFAY